MTVSCLSGAVGRSALTPATLSTGLRPLAPVLDEFWPTADQVINGVLNDNAGVEKRWDDNAFSVANVITDNVVLAVIKKVTVMLVTIVAAMMKMNIAE